MKTKSRKTLEPIRYTIKGMVEVELSAFDFDGKRCFSMYGIVSADKTENKLLDGDERGEAGDGTPGSLQCWDSNVEFIAGGLQISGADGPSGGSRKNGGVILFVPADKIKSIEIEEV